MRAARCILAAISVGLLGGCPTRPNPEGAGLTCNPDTHICLGTLLITSPTMPVHTNGSVPIQVVAMPGNNPPPQVDIRVDGMLFATIAPPFSYTWSTTGTTEGAHQVQATATVAGTTITSNSVTIWVDRTSPTISARTPVQSATNVALSDPVRITFDEPLDRSSVSDASVVLSSGGTTLVTSATLDSDGQTIVVTLGHSSLSSFPATVTATVNPSVKDLAGNPAAPGPSWAWTAPLWVKLPPLTATWGYVALDPNGRASVAYLSDTGTGGRTLGVAQYLPGATWDATIGSPAATATDAAIAIGRDGTPVVAWSSSDSSHVLAARRSGSGWAPLGGDIEASVSPVDSVVVSSIALTASGTALVGWSGQQGITNNGYVAAFSTGAWQALPPGQAAGTGGPWVRVDSKGNPVAFFPGYVGVPRMVQQYASGAWTSIDSEIGLEDMAIDSQDRPISLVSTTESNLAVFHLRHPSSSGPMDVTPSLPTGSSGTVGLARVAFGSNGNPVVLWIQQDATGANRLHVARYNGTAWDTTFGVLSGVAGNSGDVQRADIAVDASAAPTVIWTEEDTTTGSSAVYVWKSNF